MRHQISPRRESGIPLYTRRDTCATQVSIYRISSPGISTAQNTMYNFTYTILWQIGSFEQISTSFGSFQVCWNYCTKIVVHKYYPSYFDRFVRWVNRNNVERTNQKAQIVQWLTHQPGMPRPGFNQSHSRQSIIGANTWLSIFWIRESR